MKGSLAIFTGTSEPEPHPYVLLLTCFVASVFNDDVWMAAKHWLKQKLGAPTAHSPQKHQTGDAARNGGVIANAPATEPKGGA